MAASALIDSRVVVPTKAAPDSLSRPIKEPLTADEPALTWVCAFCGRLRVFEGKYPFGLSHQDYCDACGSPLAVSPVDRALVGVEGPSV